MANGWIRVIKTKDLQPGDRFKLSGKHGWLTVKSTKPRKKNPKEHEVVMDCGDHEYLIYSPLKFEHRCLRNTTK